MSLSVTAEASERSILPFGSGQDVFWKTDLCHVVGPSIGLEPCGVILLGCLSHSSLHYPERIAIILKKKISLLGKLCVSHSPCRSVTWQARKRCGSLRAPHHK